MNQALLSSQRAGVGYPRTTPDCCQYRFLSKYPPSPMAGRDGSIPIGAEEHEKRAWAVALGCEPDSATDPGNPLPVRAASAAAWTPRYAGKIMGKLMEAIAEQLRRLPQI